MRIEGYFQNDCIGLSYIAAELLKLSERIEYLIDATYYIEIPYIKTAWDSLYSKYLVCLSYYWYPKYEALQIFDKRDLN